MATNNPEMDQFTAVMVAEGVQEPEGDTPEEQEENLILAWQTLIDTGLAWSLQGWFGRTAHNLIQQGVCHSAKVGA